jgi:hypothetical protein
LLASLFFMHALYNPKHPMVDVLAPIFSDCPLIGHTFALTGLAARDNGSAPFTSAPSSAQGAQL